MAGIVFTVGFWRDRGCPLLSTDAGRIETMLVESLNVTLGDIEADPENGTKV